MNKNCTVAELMELNEHIEEMIEDILSGEFDTDSGLSFEIALCHLQEHLARTWHFSKISDERFATISQSEFHKASISIPKLNGDMKLVDANEDVI